VGVSDSVRIAPGSASWPRCLDTIEAAPEGLWVRGPLAVLRREPRIAIVGTRSPTPYGEGQALRFARAFARAGIVVVSGLARGIDQAAHRGALESGGDSIAVLGSGVDRPWPAGPVTDALLSSGLLVSEFPPGMGPRRHHFPLRNRIISGLAAGVLVVEAAWASGSLITARWAVDQGRTVFAIPGRVDHPMARGTLRLIREGATPVESPEQVLEDLFGSVAAALAARTGPAPKGPTPKGLAAEILAALEGETASADDLARQLGRPVARVLAELVELELAGAIARCPGGLYRRA